MLIGGLWHGSEWRFILWGLAHGLALVVHKIWSSYVKINESNKLFSLIGVFITFNFVSLCWIFFRSVSFETAFQSLNLIFTKLNLSEIIAFSVERKEVIILIFISMLIVFTPLKLKQFIYSKIFLLPTFTWFIWILLALQIIIQFKDEIVQPFIYFQF
jgi:D-alanyl-lipoteichoic acid acyltransferase DltB (MBOAT superfamily)